MKIRFTKEAYLKLKYFIRECPTEISGFGKVREVEVTEAVVYEDYKSSDPRDWNKTNVVSYLEPEVTKSLEVYDIEILAQEVSGTHATIDPDTMAKFLTGKMKAGLDIKDYKVWWHSHADMEAFFSLTDTTTIKQSTEFPYLISIVGNKAGDMKTRLDIYKPLRFTLEDIEIEVAEEENAEILKECRQEIKAKVKELKVFTGNYTYSGFTPSKKDKKQATKEEARLEELFGEKWRGRDYGMGLHY